MKNTATKYEVAVAKSPMCGYESDLKLTRYIRTTGKTPETETGFVFFEKTLEVAISESVESARESRKATNWNVFAVRCSSSDCWKFEAWELMANVRRIKVRAN